MPYCAPQPNPVPIPIPFPIPIPDADGDLAHTRARSLLVGWESLLSCVGKERGMLDDLRFAAAAAALVRVAIVDADDAGALALRQWAACGQVPTDRPSQPPLASPPLPTPTQHNTTPHNPNAPAPRPRAALART